MKKSDNQLLNAFSTAATIGFYLISSVIAGVIIGRLADGYFGSGPWATIVGIVLGMVSGMWAIYKKVMGVK